MDTLIVGLAIIAMFSGILALGKVQNEQRKKEVISSHV